MNKTVAIVYNASENAYKIKQKLIFLLKENNYDVIVIAPFDRYSDKFSELGVTYFRLDMNRKGENPIEELLLIAKFVKVLKLAAPDVILNFTIKPNLYGSIAAAILSIPTICNVTGLGTVFIKSGYSLLFVKLLYKIAFKFSSKIFFQNIDDKNLFDNLKLVCPKKSELIPGDGVDIDLFSPSFPQSRFDEKVVFLFIGRILRDKGVMDFVGAAKLLIEKYGNVEFQILGGVDEGNATAISLEEVMQWQSAGIINYLEYTDDVRPFLANADVVVLPSYREGMPRTILEAAAMGKPVIVTDVPGCRHAVIHGETGYLCKVQDINSLADAMENMLNAGSDQRKLLGNNGRKMIVNEFDEKIVLKKYLETIAAIMQTTDDVKLD
ncbi:MAG: glycosyltransferase family 4 protein [Nitrosomonas sp.]|nr:glycosyltransferase family 4 protein [Nitrosomonas sp.]